MIERVESQLLLMDQATKNKGKSWARWQDGTVTEHWMHKDFKDKKDQKTQTAGGSCEDCEVIRSQYQAAQMYHPSMTMRLELDVLQEKMKRIGMFYQSGKNF